MDSPDPKPKRGRPRRGDRPPIAWDAIERGYVCGEVVRQLPDGSFERSYPSIRDLAAKFGVSRSLVGYHSRRHNWPEQRLAFRDKVRTEIHQNEARTRALEASDALAVLDAYLAKFREAVESGRVRVDTISDFNVAVRLKQFLEGGADSRQEVRGGITLEEIQERHRRMREQLATMDDALAGVVVPDDHGSGGNGSSLS